jgi:hypothetical protein
MMLIILQHQTASYAEHCHAHLGLTRREFESQIPVLQVGI